MKFNGIKDKGGLTIVVDNCCSIRSKLAEIFGTNITVKLDLSSVLCRELAERCLNVIPFIICA